MPTRRDVTLLASGTCRQSCAAVRAGARGRYRHLVRRPVKREPEEEVERFSSGASRRGADYRSETNPGPCVRPCISYDAGGGCHVATSDPIAEIIGDYRAFAQRAPDSSALVFTSPQGSALRHSSFRSRCWLPALERAGLPQLGIHVLRHSAAAAMIRSGASPKTVQTVLGHASAAFTLTVYRHIFEADLDDLAERLEVAPSTRVASISRVGR